MKMKFWELVSVFRECPENLKGVLRDQKWKEFYDSLIIYKDLVTSGNRTQLDKEIPESLLLKALPFLPNRFEVIGERFLREAATSSESSLSALEAALKYGAWVLEEVFESGSARITGDADLKPTTFSATNVSRPLKKEEPPSGSSASSRSGTYTPPPPENGGPPDFE